MNGHEYSLGYCDPREQSILPKKPKRKLTLTDALCHAISVSSQNHTQPNSTHWHPDLVAITVTLREINSDIFLTQILQAFSPPGTPGNLTEPASPDLSNATTHHSLTYVCGILNCTTLDGLQLDGRRVKEKVCAAAGLPPNTTANFAGEDFLLPDPDASNTMMSARTQVFATLVGMTARTAGDAEILCKSPFNATANGTIVTARDRFASLGLDPGAYSAILCNGPDEKYDPQPPLWGFAASDAVMNRVVDVNTDLLSVILEEVATEEDWYTNMCSMIDAAGLSSTNVNGTAVRDSLCHVIR